MKIRKQMNEPRDTVLTIRMSQSEKARLKELAAALGVSVGGYLLGLALGDQVTKAWTSKTDKPDPRQMKLDMN